MKREKQRVLSLLLIVFMIFVIEEKQAKAHCEATFVQKDSVTKQRQVATPCRIVQSGQFTDICRDAADEARKSCGGADCIIYKKIDSPNTECKNGTPTQHIVVTREEKTAPKPHPEAGCILTCTATPNCFCDP
jgi:hypothetical protein